MNKKLLYFLTLLSFSFVTFASEAQPPPVIPVGVHKRGLKPTPKWKLLAAPKHKVTISAPPQFATVPKQLSMWLNDQYGDCVTAQEAFSKAVWSVQCGLPELFVPDAEVKRFASTNNLLDGADLTQVMDLMAKDGFNVGGVNYRDGPYASVDFSNESVLQNAIATGPVNLGLDASALPGGAGSNQGWFATGGTPGQYQNEDHCCALCGYGPAEYLYQQLGVALPAGLAGKSGYLFFTWSTIGFVDHAWIMSTVGEAWVRSPTTPGQSPNPIPPTTITLPQEVGQSFANAKIALAALGLVVSPVSVADPSQLVTLQTPASGTVVATGSTVTLTVGTNPTPPSPPVTGIGRVDVFDTNGTLIASLKQSGGLTPDEISTLQALVAKLVSSPEQVPIRPPSGWVTDTRISKQIALAMEKQGGTASADYAKVASDGEAHPILMRMIYRHMRLSKDPAAAKLLAQYNDGAPPPGWFINILNWFVANGPAILAFIQTIMKMFGL